jgi:hypothetical protein
LSGRDPNGLYSHQTGALQAVLDGRDICVATATVSGSLVFMGAAADALLRDRTARVLALCPAKALTQDHLEKWNEFLQPFGEKARGHRFSGIWSPANGPREVRRPQRDSHAAADAAMTEEPGGEGHRPTSVASPISASWNQLYPWIRAVDGLRRAA